MGIVTWKNRQISSIKELYPEGNDLNQIFICSKERKLEIDIERVFQKALKILRKR